MTEYKPGGPVSSSSVVATFYDSVRQKAVPKDAVVLDLAEFDLRVITATLRTMGFRTIADQIEAQTRPAIEEPKGLGAVVEDEAGTQFVKASESTWVLIGNATHWTWDEVHAVRVLPEGVKP